MVRASNSPRAFPPPFEFGAPARYTSWRGPQLDGIIQNSNSEKRFRGNNWPTGSGKTLAAYMLIAMHGSRGLILTENLGLMDQYREDLAGATLKVAELRGMSNYVCPALRPGGRYSHLADSRRGTNCDAGPCRVGMPCELRTGGCPYFDAERKAADADVVVSNYSKRAVTDDETDVLGKFGWLILDELHAAPEAVARSLRIDVSTEQVAELLSMNSPDVRHATVRDWSEWGHMVGSRCTAQQTRLRGQMRLARESGSVDRYDLDRLSGLQRIQGLADKLVRLGADTGNWIVTQSGRNTVSFDVLWPKDHCHRLLYRDVPNVVGMSATARPKTMEYLGLKPDDYDFFEQPSTFPVENRPVYVVPYAYVQWNMPPEDTRRWLRGIDTLLTKHGADRRVLVDTVSYDRQRLITESSGCRERMLSISGAGKRSHETAKLVEYFLDGSPEDAVLVGPQFWGGYNFIGSRCELAVAAKLMFPDARDPLVAARSKSDPEYRSYTTVQRVVQFFGRIVRARWDRGMGVIADAHALRFFDPDRGNRKYAPRYFLDALKIVRNGLLPVPLKKLTAEEESCQDE